MKKNIIILLFCLLPSLLIAEDYFWHNGNRVTLKEGKKKFILYDNSLGVGNDSCFISHGIYQNNKQWAIVNASFKKVSHISYESSSYVSDVDSSDIFVSNRFYVKLKSELDYGLLREFALNKNVTIVDKSSVPLWYILECPESLQKTALFMSNLFYESLLFEASEPEFLNVAKPLCVNDLYFPNQWNLYNTGQHAPVFTNIDINYCQANGITQGEASIIVAVLDQGVDLLHEDLNLYDLSYDTERRTSPSFVYGNHGTACAGIVGAICNNNIGVAGIAPNCPIMSISTSLSIPTNVNNLANGFAFAANNGASVISNSWYSTIVSSLLDDAIEYALEEGRNGLGCIITFAAGNFNSSVLYPASSNSDIIVVGAMSPCGERKNPYSCDGENWGSCYGTELDVIAPGVKIPTTDRTGGLGSSIGNYYMEFNGTSSACPHVAAIAALVLSVNPKLTQKEVADIIESTAQKVGLYTYVTTSGRPNGTWNNEMGYGLVDAYAAVLAAKDKYIQDTTYANGSIVHESYPEIFAGYSVTDNIPYGNVIVKSGSNVTYKATEAIHLKPGFRVENGATFHAQIESPSPSSSSSPSSIRTDEEAVIETNISEVEGLPNTITLSPNPAIDHIVLSSSKPITHAKIYTLSGQFVLQSAETQIDVSALPAGLYVVYALTTDGQYHQAKFVHL